MISRNRMEKTSATPRLSVVTVNFNNARGLELTARSIAGQTAAAAAAAAGAAAGVGLDGLASVAAGAAAVVLTTHSLIASIVFCWGSGPHTAVYVPPRQKVTALQGAHGEKGTEEGANGGLLISEKCSIIRKVLTRPVAEQGRTSRGVSGALYLQPATAGMNPGPRTISVSSDPHKRR